MESNASDSGGRVTRSLRKRLTSVDSENSSRPGTPISSKLTSISEIGASPSKAARITRRNSICSVATPVKTPVKRGMNSLTIVENLETKAPSRRNYRKLSVSLNDNELADQTRLELPIFEEEVIVTRSKSKSPLQSNNLKTSSDPKSSKSVTSEKEFLNTKVKFPKKRKIGPKSRTREDGESDDISDVEVNVLDIKNNSCHIKTITFTDNESIQASNTSTQKGEENVKDVSELSCQLNVAVEEIIKTNELPMGFQQEEIENIVQIPDIVSDNIQEKNISGQKQYHDTENVKDVSELSCPLNTADKEIINNKAFQQEEIENIIQSPLIVSDNIQEKNISGQKQYHDTENVKDVSELSCPLNVTDEEIINTNELPMSFQQEEIENIIQSGQNQCHDSEKENYSTRYQQSTVKSPTGFQMKDIENKNQQNHHNHNKMLEKTFNDEDVTKIKNEAKLKEFNLKENVNNVMNINEVNHASIVEKKPLPPNEVETLTESTFKDDINRAGKEKSFSSDKDENERDSSSNVCVTPETNKKSVLMEKVKNYTVSTTTIYDCKEASKKVDFISSPSNDVAIKNVYPKTPASTKATNTLKDFPHLNDVSFQAEFCSFLPNLDNDQNINRTIEDYNIQINRKEKDELHVTQTDMATGLSVECQHTLEITQSSTPINKESLKYQNYTQVHYKDALDKQEEINAKKISNELKNTETEMKTKHTVECPHTFEISESSPPMNNKSLNQNGNEILAKKISNELESTQHEELGQIYELKWINPSVKGKTADISMIDSVLTNPRQCYDNINNAKDYQNNKQNTEKKIEEEENNYNDRKELYDKKHDFIDNEAMEVDNYESGDSIDSEERRDLEENEIPVDAESISSQTTDEEYCEEEHSVNSFIVSDNESVSFSESDDEIFQEIDVETNEHNIKMKKSYNRIQRPAYCSSSSDEEVTGNILQSPSNSSSSVKIVENNLLNNSEDRNREISISHLEKNKSRNETLSERNSVATECQTNLCKSIIKENKSVNKSIDSKSREEYKKEEINNTRKDFLHNLNHSDRLNKSVRYLDLDASSIENDQNLEMDRDNNNKKINFNEELTASSSSFEDDHIVGNENLKQDERQKASVTSDSDADEENKVKSLNIPYNLKPDSRLSVSFGNQKKLKGKQEWQRSFTIDVAVKHGELKAKVTDANLKKNESVSLSDNKKNVEQEKGKCLENLENIKHMPLLLGNPLVRTRRQSLALPTNPNMEICSSNVGAVDKNRNRKSLGVLSNIDFKPSQSFIETIELQKNEHRQIMAKRKRLSKSFCGFTESHDNSIVDIDICHLNKRSKLADRNSFEESHFESKENIDSVKLFTKMSSTPHEKFNKTDYCNKSILERCDEAANSHKMEAKISNNNKKEKPEAKTHLLKNDEKSARLKKKLKNENIEKKCKNENVISTSAGNFMELPQSPEKKMKRLTYIQLPTGKVSIEPITPNKRIVQAYNGMVFRESPATPYARGFKVSKIKPPVSNILPQTIVRIGKRKRCHDEANKFVSKPKTHWTKSGLFIEEEIPKYFSQKTKKQWTQSGLFIEEEILKDCQFGLQKSKKRLAVGKQHNANNIKENALPRSESLEHKN